MPSRSPIPLFPQPPFSPQGGPPSDESDFPPIRIREDVSMSETHPHPILTPDLSDRLTMNWLQITCLLVNMWAPQTNPRGSPVACSHSVGQVDLPSEESDFPPIRIHEDVSMPETLPHPILTPGLSDRLTMNRPYVPYLLVNMWASRLILARGPVLTPLDRLIYHPMIWISCLSMNTQACPTPHDVLDCPKKASDVRIFSITFIQMPSNPRYDIRIYL